MATNKTTTETPTPKPKWTKVVDEMLGVIEHSISNTRESDISPKKLAQEVIAGLCRVMGGQVIYLPFANVFDRATRNKEIYDLWKAGGEIKDLARSYKMAVQTIYDIIARERSSVDE